MNFRFWVDEFWILGMEANLNSRYKEGSKGGTFLFAEAKDLFSCKLKDAVLGKVKHQIIGTFTFYWRCQEIRMVRKKSEEMT